MITGGGLGRGLKHLYSLLGKGNFPGGLFGWSDNYSLSMGGKNTS